jgi:glucose/arabinose dehydrogenase
MLMPYVARRDRFRRPLRGGAVSWMVLGVAAWLLAVGCTAHPRLYTGPSARVIDRKFVEYPAGYQLTLVADGLTAPGSVAFAPDGSVVVAEAGTDAVEPRIYGWRADGQYFQVYPKPDSSPFAFLKKRFRLYAPIGGMVFHDGALFVSHRDENRAGVITRIDLDGNATTVVADLPAKGDHAVTDLTVSATGRLVFGVGTATNSGVVGVDNFTTGWVQRYPRLSDQSYVPLKLFGYRFNTPNPRAGLFGGDDVAVTAPFQSFGVSNQTRVPASSIGKPNGAIYSISPTGGDLRVEAHGIRMPRGLRYSEFGRLYATNNGMELRGTRPVQDDPDALLRIVTGTWYGWPDFTADLRPISDLPISDVTKGMIVRSGYPDLAYLIDHGASNLLAPNRDTLVSAAFPSQSGAAKFDFVPEESPFRAFRGNAIVALSGDRAPFATGGQQLKGTVGHEVKRVDMDTRQERPFIYNTRGAPASRIPKTEAGDAMERPVDVKFAPDGSMYIVDFGRMRMRGGNPDVTRRTGRMYRLIPLPPTAPATQPATE